MNTILRYLKILLLARLQKLETQLFKSFRCSLFLILLHSCIHWRIVWTEGSIESHIDSYSIKNVYNRLFSRLFFLSFTVCHDIQMTNRYRFSWKSITRKHYERNIVFWETYKMRLLVKQLFFIRIIKRL